MTGIKPTTLLYTQDADLARSVTAFVGGRARIRTLDTPRKFRAAFGKADHVVSIIDLCAEDAWTLVEEIAASRRSLPVLALGTPGTEPYIQAQQSGVYATEPLPLDRRTFQCRITEALTLTRLTQENQDLRTEVDQVRHAAQAHGHPAAASAMSGAGVAPLGSWGRALRHIGDVNALVESIVHGVADTMLVARVGLFARTGRDEDFAFRSGIRCLEPTKNLRFEADDLLVQWLEEQACQLARSHLEHIADPQARAALRADLDDLGAEVIVPLQGRGRLIGWLFVGHRGTGQPLTVRDQEELLVVAGTVAITLENALLYEEMTLQKTMAETLLHTMPSGIIAVDTEGIVQSYNQAAATVLSQASEDVLQHPVTALGSHLTDLLLRALKSDLPDIPMEWTHPRSRKHLLAEARRLTHRDTCLGAVVIIQDLTQKRQLDEKQDHLERASFWNDLAASMSHEIRNPLVAIKTFAQLLPERYQDADFRSEFSELVTKEVDRLNQIVEQINDFAHPPELRFNALDVPRMLQNSLDAALKRVDRNGVAVETSFDETLPPVWGDGTALSECFVEIIQNALEGAGRGKDPQIVLTAKHLPSANGSDEVTVTIEDNGPGIPDDEREKVFSPFCTSKAQGMGLGLPIARRTVIDHDGHIDLTSGDEGTRVSIGLPTTREGNAS